MDFEKILATTEAIANDLSDRGFDSDEVRLVAEELKILAAAMQAIETDMPLTMGVTSVSPDRSRLQVSCGHDLF